MTTKEVIEKLKQGNDIITGQIIKDLIKDHIPEKNRTKRLYAEYKGDVEVKNREFDDPNKINNKLPNDYRGDIIDQITGYLFGEPINYDVDKNEYKESEFKKVMDELRSFKSRNSIDDLDSTTGEIASICGYAARLLYIDKEGKERVIDVKPWETIFVFDPTLDEVQYGLIYYDITIVESGKKTTRTKVEFYDKENVHFFISTKDGDYIRDLNEPENPKKHMFNTVPLVRFDNNNILQGDFEKVDDLIDSYDRVLSDIQNEVEEFRLAYLAFYGVEPKEEVIRQARRTGAFYFPEGTDGKFITKPLDDAVEFVKDHKNTLNENIYKFSKSIDMRNEKFSGSSISGESRKWQLVPLENKAKTKERKFTKALRKQFKILQSVWNKKEIPFDAEKISFQFTRNLPVDLKYQAETTQILKGNVSEKTRLSLLSFIDDPEKELEQIKSEQGDFIDFGNNNPQANE